MSHYCSRSSCPEWYRGECFGGGCETNPAPEDDGTMAEEIIDDNDNDNNEM